MTKGDIVYCYSDIDGEKSHPYLITKVSEDNSYIEVLLITHSNGEYGTGKKMKLHSTDIPGMYLKYSFLGLSSRLIAISSCVMSFKGLKISNELRQKLNEYGHEL